PEKRRNNSSSFPKKGMKKEIQNREKRRKTIKIFMNHYGYRPKPKPGTNPTRTRETTPKTAPPSQQHRTSKNYE
ncbi:MAG: hypothetical protein ACTSWF_06410, partial [Candidatus Freyarchaeota archaeon]